ncbi:transposase [Streptomyces sp. NPDC057557]|uniref:transposase n=1 Tax=Streptomyces sp. NPDC057557 TaxID=3346167 RepID=UPI003697B4C8
MTTATPGAPGRPTRSVTTLQAYVAEHLGTDNGVLITDDTGFVKKGSKSAGVQRRHCGQERRIRDPCRIDVGRGGPFDERVTGKGPSVGTTRSLRRGPPGCVRDRGCR